MRKILLSLGFSLIIVGIILFTSISLVANKGINSHLASRTIIKKGIPQKNSKDSTHYTPIINTNLTSTVFGYLPYWQYENARKTIRYELLTHIAAFDFKIDEAGNITNPDNWPWSDVINEGHKNGVKIIMTVFSSDSSMLHQVLTDSLKKVKAFRNIKNTITEFNLDGVNVDFEVLKRSDRNTVINDFMHRLTNYLHSELPGVEVSFAGPAVNWGGWNFKQLAEACDYIFIMGYDYFPQTSLVSGPSASLTGSFYSVESTVLDEFFGYGEVTESNPEKLILGVPYFGNHWVTETKDPQSINLQHVESITYEAAMKKSSSYKVLWQNSFQVPWFRYTQDGIWHQVWFDNQKSISLKYDFAISHGFKGVGMWALGYDGNRAELWNIIKSRFYIPQPFGLNAITMNNKELSNKDSEKTIYNGIFIPKALKLVSNNKSGA
ncbi:MAG: glycosyl hydrolase family 18 protein [Bacteroidota bacterium]|nr:glycosyl hydrolase family 18 protein [Bacteroidota bacterium]